MFTYEQIISFRANYVMSSNKEDKRLVVEAIANMLKDNKNSEADKMVLESLISNLQLSMHSIYGDDGHPDMKVGVMPINFSSVPYHNGKPDENNPQRGLYNGKIVKSHADKIINIVDNALSYKFGLITVNYDSKTGKIEVLDGASRLIALILLGYKNALFGVFTDLTPEEKRNIYDTQAENRRAISALDMFMSNAGGSLAKHEASKLLYEIGTEYGITFMQDYNLVHNCTSVSYLENFAKHYKEDGLRWVFQIIKDADYHKWLHTYRRHFLSAIGYAYSMLELATIENPKELLLADLKDKLDPDTFEQKARPVVNPEFTTKGKNGEGPMMEYICELFGIHTRYDSFYDACKVVKKPE